MREASAAMDYEAAARLPRPAAGDRRRARARARSCSATDTDADLFGIARGRARRRGAAVRDPRRPRARRARDDDREGARHPGRRAGRPGAAARVRRRATPTSRARCSSRRCPTTPPTSRSGCASGAARGCRSRSPARAQGRAAGDGDAQRPAGAHAPQDAAHERLRRARRRRSPTCRRRSASPRRRCASSASTSRTSAARTSSPRWSCSRTGCRARTSTARSAIPETTDDTDSLYQVLTRRLAYLDRPERAASRASRRREPTPTATVDGTTPQAPRFAYRRSCWSSTAASRRSRPRRARSRDAGHEEIALCGIAKRLEEVWLPGEEYPVILPRTSEALYLLQRLRDEAHRFAITHQRRRRRRDIRACWPRSPGSARRASRRCCATSARWPRSSAATPEEIAELPGVGPEARRGDPSRTSRRWYAGAR